MSAVVPVPSTVLTFEFYTGPIYFEWISYFVYMHIEEHHHVVRDVNFVVVV